MQKKYRGSLLLLSLLFSVTSLTAKGMCGSCSLMGVGYSTSYPPIPFYVNSSHTAPYGWIYPGVGVQYPMSYTGGTGYGYPSYGMGYGYPSYGMGYGSPSYGMGYGYPSYGTGYGYPSYGMGYGYPSFGTGYGYPSYGMGGLGGLGGLSNLGGYPGLSLCNVSLGSFGLGLGMGLGLGSSLGLGSGLGSFTPTISVPIGMIPRSGINYPGNNYSGIPGVPVVQPLSHCGNSGGVLSGIVSPSIQYSIPRDTCNPCGLGRYLMRPILRAATKESHRFY